MISEVSEAPKIYKKLFKDEDEKQALKKHDSYRFRERYGHQKIVQHRENRLPERSQKKTFPPDRESAEPGATPAETGPAPATKADAFMRESD